MEISRFRDQGCKWVRLGSGVEMGGFRDQGWR